MEYKPYCENCVLRLYNDLGHNIKGIGNALYGNMIILPYIDKSTYKAQDLSYNGLYKMLKDIHFLSTGEDLLDRYYITTLIKCKESRELIIDNNILLRCSKYLNYEVVNYGIKRILMLGNVGNRLLGRSVDINDAYFSGNGIMFCSNYSPSVKLYDANKSKVFDEYYSKWLNLTKNNTNEYNVVRI